MTTRLKRGVGAFGLASLFAVAGCKDDSVQRVAPPGAAATQPTPGGVRFALTEKGTASFLIDAPLEKIKGHSGKVRGEITLVPSDLTTTRGEIDVDLKDLATETFDDASQNSTQTGHAHNWIEIGDDVEPKRREENRFARFTIRSVDATASKLADAPEQNGVRTITVTAQGDLWVHGVSSPKSVKLTAMFQGPPGAPTGLHLMTAEPLTLSLKEHDIKPRDVAGKFLSGALEKVGKKIDDAVQINLDLTARTAKS
jgi:hypothetical protein